MPHMCGGESSRCALYSSKLFEVRIPENAHLIWQSRSSTQEVPTRGGQQRGQRLHQLLLLVDLSLCTTDITTSAMSTMTASVLNQPLVPPAGSTAHSGVMQ